MSREEDPKDPKELEEYRLSLVALFEKNAAFDVITKTNNDRIPFDLSGYTVTRAEAVPGMRYNYADASDPFHMWINWPKNIYVVRIEGVFVRGTSSMYDYMKDIIMYLSDGTSQRSHWCKPLNMVLMNVTS